MIDISRAIVPLAALALVAALAPSPSALAQEAPTLGCEGDIATASISDGALRGACEGGIASFKGVPYAAPPVGEMRLRDPTPAAPWEGTLDGTNFGPACPQGMSVGDLEMDEDCLSLNLWAPAEGEGKPVMVWIHGGAYLLGSGGQPIYDGAALASLGDVVVVTINYRLGALGFLAADALAQESAAGTAGNYGSKDQLLALAWVRDNINAFGGDPGNVTVFGESAGAGSICALLGAPSADGLFHKAIIQSGPFCTQLPEGEASSRASAPVKARAQGMVSDLGCGDAEDVPACLRALPVETFVEAVDAIDLLFGGSAKKEIPTAPYVDGAFITDQPLKRLAEGRVDMPILLGSTRDETSLFFAFTPIPTRLAFSRKLRGVGLPDESIAEIKSLYPVSDYLRGRRAFIAFTTDTYFACPTLGFADAAAQGAPAYLYEMHKSAWPTRILRSHHGLDVAFTFGNLDGRGWRDSPRNQAFAQQVGLAWTDFARDGHIEGWPAYEPGGLAYILDDEPYLAPALELRKGRCEGLSGL